MFGVSDGSGGTMINDGLDDRDGLICSFEFEDVFVCVFVGVLLGVTVLLSCAEAVPVCEIVFDAEKLLDEVPEPVNVPLDEGVPEVVADGERVDVTVELSVLVGVRVPEGVTEIVGLSVILFVVLTEGDPLIVIDGDLVCVFDGELDSDTE
jgi:hypothetical protein